MIDLKDYKLIGTEPIDVLALEGIKDKRDKWDVYNFCGQFNVPRVTHILDETIGKKFLTKWAASLGKDYYKKSREILDTGSLVHEKINDFLSNGALKESYDLAKTANFIEAQTSYNNFLQWYSDTLEKNISITPILLEYPLVTPWFGGTMDALIKFENPNNEVDSVYVVDFKTSSKISYEYFLQTMCYYIAIEFYRNNPAIAPMQFPEVDGLMVLRFDKTHDQYQVQTFEFNLLPGIDTPLRDAVWSMINWFYQKNHIEWYYRKNHR